MSGLRTLSFVAVAPLFLLGFPHALMSYVQITNLWKYLQKHHFLTWVALGGQDAWSELHTKRGIGSMRKIYSTLEPIDDAELKKMISDMKQSDRFARRVLVPLFLVAVVLLAADALINAFV